MHSQFRGEAIYTAEVDVHFPMLTVGDTLAYVQILDTRELMYAHVLHFLGSLPRLAPLGPHQLGLPGASSPRPCET
jgi:hypothetical protein